MSSGQHHHDLKSQYRIAVAVVGVFVLNAVRLNRDLVLELPLLYDSMELSSTQAMLVVVDTFSVDFLLLTTVLPALLWSRWAIIRFQAPTPMEWGLLAVALIPIVMILSQKLADPPGRLLLVPQPVAGLYLLKSLLVGLFIEEFLFRSFLQEQARTWNSPLWVHVLIGLMFLMTHFPHSLMALWMPGWMFLWSSVAYARSGSLTIPMLAHFVHNVMVMVPELME